MPCTRPLNAYRVNGKVFFTPSHGAEFIQLPCGQCVACRLNHSRQWATRMVHEAYMHEHNSFITLTYDNEHLPEDGSLVRKHLTDFFKRFRLLMVPESSFSNADTNKLHTDAPMACPTRQNTGKNFRHFGAFPNGLSPHLRMRKIT